MPEIPTWLDRLDRATDYRELQEIFSEIASQAQSGSGYGDLAGHIDEAVRRVEAERVRDERELQEIQSRYETFREENKGVVGWFKRHIPFTETRRQEGEYKGDVAEQAAEILADNLVIARAQMLKERFLNPADRKLGQRPAEWRARLENAAADSELALLGQALKDIAGDCRHRPDSGGVCRRGHWTGDLPVERARGVGRRVPFAGVGGRHLRLAWVARPRTPVGRCLGAGRT